MKLQLGCVGALCASVAVSSAHAGVTFSFSADSNNAGPEFTGQSAPTLPFNIASDGGIFNPNSSVIVELLVDVNGAMPGGGTVFNSIFDFSGVTASYSVIPFGNGYAHHWVMSGSFTLTETGSGLEVLRVDFNQALFSSFSDSTDLLASTATLQTSETLDAGLTFTAGAPLVGLGVTNADLALGENFAFALSNIQAVGNSSAPLTLGANGNWMQNWIGDASFTAGASAIPAPGAIALLMLGIFMGWRGRRRLA